MGEKLVPALKILAKYDIIPDSILNDPIFHKKEAIKQIEDGQNYAGWNSEPASSLLEAARIITDTGRRSDLYFEFQRIFNEETPSLIINYPIYSFGVSNTVFGVQTSPMTTPSDRFKTVPNWYLLTRRVVYSQTQVGGFNR